MAAVVTWKEDNGAATGSPARGTTRTGARTEANFKNVDDSTTAWSASVVPAGSSSFEKFQYAVFGGAFNLISAGKWAHTAGVLGVGMTLKGTVTSNYTTPAAAANAALTTDMTAVTPIASGLSVLFSLTDPSDQAPTSTLNAAGFSQYLVAQMQTTVAAAPGDSATGTLMLQFNES